MNDKNLELLTASDAAHIAKVTPDTIRNWSKNGTLPIAVRTPSGIRLFRRADVARVAAARPKRTRQAA